MRNIPIVKYRKLLETLQRFCREQKSHLYCDMIRPKKTPTEFERGVIDGKHAAYNSVMKELHAMIEYAETDWDYTSCREETKDDQGR